MVLNNKTGPLLTAHSLLFSRTIVEIERFALRAVILDESQTTKGAGVDHAPPPRAI